MTEHGFTGVFIPAHIWLCTDLIPAEKMLLGEIDALSKRTGWCTAGREHFAKWLNCTAENVTYYTRKLEAKGLIQIERISGAGNKMRVIAEGFYTETQGDKPRLGGKPDLRGGVNDVYGGGKGDLPNIQVKDKEEIPSPQASKTRAPKPTVEPWTTKVAETFEAVRSTKFSSAGFECPKFIWSARYFKELKETRKLLAQRQAERLRRDATEGEILDAFKGFFEVGFDWLHGIQERKGGAINYDPATLRNNYNAILNHALNGKNPAKAQEQKQGVVKIKSPEPFKRTSVATT